MVRRNLLLAWSFGLVASLSFAGTGRGFAQDAEKVPAPAAEKTEAPAETAKKDEAKPAEPKKDEAKPAEPKKDEAKPAEPKKDEAKAPETAADQAPPTVPPEVMAKIEAARHAVAEAIVAAQDAGLIETSIDPPPVLDILVQGYAIDARTLKHTDGKKPYPVSPEVFGAWFTGYGKLEGINYQSDVRIINPSAGLKTWYDQRAGILNRHIEAVRKANGTAAPAPKTEEKKAEPKAEEKKAEPKAEEKKEEPKAEEKKEEPKAEEKKEEPKAEEPKKD